MWVIEHRQPVRRRVVLALFAATVIAIALIVFWPSTPDGSGQSALRTWLWQWHRAGGPAWITFGRVEFTANVAMFLPLGLLGALILRRHRWLVVPACLLASMVIEITQGTLLPGRFGDPRDVVANTLGGLIGYLLAVAGLRLRAALLRGS